MKANYLVEDSEALYKNLYIFLKML